MLNFLKKETNKTTTENGAATYLTTQSDCLDLFATIGALRNEREAEKMNRFDRAWAENRDLALKTLFFARDIRGGLGERAVFRTIIRNMSQQRSKSIIKNLWAIPEFGRFDDLLCLLDTPARDSVFAFIKELFSADMTALEEDKTVSLLGKWLPSVNAHNADTVRYGKMIAASLSLSEAQYRKSLSALRARIAIIENNLRERDYSFDYSMQPSKAMMKYRKAFIRNDGERYSEYLSKVEGGEAKLNTVTLMPYEIIRSLFYETYSDEISYGERRSLDVTWKAQKDYTSGENAIVVVDGSGSMYSSQDPLPITVALSLGIYFAERNNGAFKNHFITFSEKPRLVEIKGNDIYEKVKYAASYNEVASTNIQNVFELILNTAVKNRLPQSELPAKIYVISDMEFNACTKGAKLTNFEYAKRLFNEHGYTLPKLIFWNVQSRNEQQPVTMNEEGVVLVSGASPRVFSMITSENISPYTFMTDILGAQRYAGITA